MIRDEKQPMKKLAEIPPSIIKDLDHSRATLEELTDFLYDAHHDHIPAENTKEITVCAYCGQETKDPCCGENHHEKIIVKGDK